MRQLLLLFFSCMEVVVVAVVVKGEGSGERVNREGGGI
jgi:hypothetical protein